MPGMGFLSKLFFSRGGTFLFFGEIQSLVLFYYYMMALECSSSITILCYPILFRPLLSTIQEAAPDSIIDTPSPLELRVEKRGKLCFLSPPASFSIDKTLRLEIFFLSTLTWRFVTSNLGIRMLRLQTPLKITSLNLLL